MCIRDRLWLGLGQAAPPSAPWNAAANSPQGWRDSSLFVLFGYFSSHMHLAVAERGHEVVQYKWSCWERGLDEASSFSECKKDAKRNKHVSNRATMFPLLVTTFSKLRPAQGFLQSLDDVACSTGVVDRGSWLRIAQQYLSCALVRGCGIVCRLYCQSMATSAGALALLHLFGCNKKRSCRNVDSLPQWHAHPLHQKHHIALQDKVHRSPEFHASCVGVLPLSRSVSMAVTGKPARCVV